MKTKIEKLVENLLKENNSSSESLLKDFYNKFKSKKLLVKGSEIKRNSDDDFNNFFVKTLSTPIGPKDPDVKKLLDMCYMVNKERHNTHFNKKNLVKGDKSINVNILDDKSESGETYYQFYSREF